MNPSVLSAIILFFIICGASRQQAVAQTTYGFSDLTYDEATNTLYGHSVTYPNYNVAGYYKSIVASAITDRTHDGPEGYGYTFVAWGGNEGDGTVEVNIQATPQPNTEYRLTALHSLRTIYEQYFYAEPPYEEPSLEYLDQYGYSFAGEGGNSYYYSHAFYGNGIAIWLNEYQRVIDLGETYDASGIPDDEVTFINASLYDNSTSFDNNLHRAVLTISPSSKHAQEICGEDAGFVPLIVSFRLPDTTKSLSTTRSYARAVGEPPNRNEWYLPASPWAFQNVRLESGPNKEGEMRIYVHYKGKGEDVIYNSIKIGVAGDYTTTNGAFRTEATVKLICP